ncbi:hypothetical protein J6590_009808 [Homalodisca vitripennis]|nr:hypothetical protein J6590_009808 [Homalodisca vitripennis]
MACCDDTVSEDGNNERVKVRGCTDLFWLLIYILFWVLMILIAGFALVYGNPLRLIHGYDSFGNTCGSSYNDQLLTNGNLSGINTVNKRYLFFMDVHNIRNSLQICVEKCSETVVQIGRIVMYRGRHASIGYGSVTCASITCIVPTKTHWCNILMASTA